MGELDHKEGWASKNWCFWTVVLEKSLESLLDCKDIKPVNPKGNQPWKFIGRTDAEAKVPILWPPDAKSWLIGKDPDAGKDWGQGEKGMTEDEMIGWHHRLDEHELQPTLGDSEVQGSLACCSPWVCKESDITQRLNWTELRELRQETCCRKAGSGRGGQSPWFELCLPKIHEGLTASILGQHHIWNTAAADVSG